MSGIYGILTVGRDAILAQQKGIAVTGHNIANVNTPGYSRQRVSLSASAPYVSRGDQTGGGVRVQNIERIYDRFLGNQILSENQELGKWEAQTGILRTIEGIFSETEDYGVSQAMSRFWNAWEDLANNPGGGTERLLLASRGESLAESFNAVSKELNGIRTDTDLLIRDAVSQINRITRGIAEMNQLIGRADPGGDGANDLRDSRDEMLRELSLLTDITVNEDSSGRVSVTGIDGRILVDGFSSRDLAVSVNDITGLLDVEWIDPDGTAADITARLTGGKLGGWLSARDRMIPEYLGRLDDLAAGIIEHINTLHAAGYGLHDPATGVPYGGDAFFTGSSAADMGVNPLIPGDPNRIAAASDPLEVPGGGGNARAIASLRNLSLMAGGTSGFDGLYRDLVGKVGSDVRGAAANFERRSDVAENLANLRASFSGVSIEEEMVNLLKFEHAFQAAARLTQTADELLQTIIDMV